MGPVGIEPGGRKESVLEDTTDHFCGKESDKE